MKHTKLFIKIAAMLLALCLLAVGCSSSKPASNADSTADADLDAEIAEAEAELQETGEETAATTKASAQDGGTWAVYMYFCGSDLESDFSCATKNLLALMRSARTSDTIFVAETGGTTLWKNNFVDATKTQRWLYTDGDMEIVDEQPLSNMGDPDTLADFLTYAKTNYPADHTMVILWDHGNGTLKGCCVDDNFDGDRLNVGELHEAFAKAYDLSEENPPIDIIGFDCCLMATIDIADTFKDIAHYLIASEETEPGLGWNYDAIGSGLGKDPTMSAYDLGVLVCDSYYQGLVDGNQADSATLSLTDLSKFGVLKDAFTAFADEMIVKAYNDPKAFRNYAFYAKFTENYSSNSRAQGYTCLADIRNFAQNAHNYLDTADALIDAVDTCVVYKVNGEYRSQGGGLSFYFDYDGIQQKNDLYVENGTIEALKVLYNFGVSGTVDESGAAYMRNLGLDPDNLPTVMTFDNYDFGGVPVQINENGRAYADFGSDVSNCVVDAMYYMYYVKDDGTIYYIGSDDEVHGDYTTGVITEQMNDRWGYFDGNLCFMELTYDSDNYNLYSVPIKVGGKKYFLQVAYDYTTKTWEVLGARKDGGQTAMTSRALYIEDGTEITLLEYPIGDDGQPVETDGATFIYYAGKVFDYVSLPNGEYMMKFVLEDVYLSRAVSQMATFDLEDGVITYRQ